MLLFSLILSLSAHAGNGNVVGNGGNTISCPAPLARSAIFVRGRAVLDLAEGESIRGYRYSRLVALRGLSLEKAFPRAVALFAPHSLFVRQQLLAHFSRRASEIRWTSGALPVSTFSRLQLFGCSLEQAAVQFGFSQPSPADRLELLLNRPLWNSLATDQQVALLFHEYLMKHRLLMNGACTVNQIREITAFVLSDDASGLSSSRWTEVVDKGCTPDPERGHR